jgi:hypothetical protein
MGLSSALRPQIRYEVTGSNVIMHVRMILKWQTGERGNGYGVRYGQDRTRGRRDLEAAADDCIGTKRQ